MASTKKKRFLTFCLLLCVTVRVSYRLCVCMCVCYVMLLSKMAAETGIDNSSEKATTTHPRLYGKFHEIVCNDGGGGGGSGDLSLPYLY